MSFSVVSPPPTITDGRDVVWRLRLFVSWRILEPISCAQRRQTTDKVWRALVVGNMLLMLVPHWKTIVPIYPGVPGEVTPNIDLERVRVRPTLFRFRCEASFVFGSDKLGALHTQVHWARLMATLQTPKREQDKCPKTFEPLTWRYTQVPHILAFPFQVNS